MDLNGLFAEVPAGAFLRRTTTAYVDSELCQGYCTLSLCPWVALSHNVEWTALYWHHPLVHVTLS